MSFSLLVFDDTAATPVDKPFHAVFPMDVAQVQVSHMQWGCEKYFIQYNLAGITEIFSLNISRLGSGTSACPLKNAEHPAYHQDNDSQQASMLYR